MFSSEINIANIVWGEGEAHYLEFSTKNVKCVKSFVRDCLYHFYLLYSVNTCVLRSTFIHAIAFIKGHDSAKVDIPLTISLPCVRDYLNLGVPPTFVT